MPELPEVEIICHQLEKLIVGKTISSIEVLNPGSFRAKKDSLIGKTITKVGRKGKVLIIRFEKRDRDRKVNHKSYIINHKSCLFIHLKMSGRLGYKEKGRRKREEGKTKNHIRVIIIFTDRSELEFYDQRKFGWISGDLGVLPRGVDALDPKLTPKKLAEILASSNRPVKTILLDQSKIAGIGNIYASEILWEAEISPLAKFGAKGQGLRAKGRNDEKFAKLHTAIRRVLTEAIDSGGSTMNDQLYRHVSGQTGNYWSRRRVYDREGEPCLRCKIPIKKGIIGQRSTYFCPSCQK